MEIMTPPQQLIPRAICLMLPTLALADPVDETQVTTFSAGQPACAEEVNQTIQALIAAVNDNAEMVARLEARLASVSRPLSERLEDSSYKFYVMASGAGFKDDFVLTYDEPTTPPDPPPANPHPDDPNIERVTHQRLVQRNFSQTGTLNLNANGSLSLSTQSRTAGGTIDNSLVKYFTSPDEITSPASISLLDESEPDVVSGTWSLSGQTLTLNIGGDTVAFFVSPEGDMLMAGGEDEGEEDYELNSSTFTVVNARLAVGIRVAAPEIAVTAIANGDATQVNSGQTLLTSTTGIVIVNKGDGDLTITNINGGFFDLVGITLPVSLLPGESMYVPTTLSDSNGSPINGTIVSNSVTSPTFTLVDQ